jgi:hypothetical protein
MMDRGDIIAHFVSGLRFGRSVWFALAVLCSSIHLAVLTYAQNPKTPTEKYVLDQVRLGNAADLRRLKNKKISHVFLEDLMTSSSSMRAAATYGITIIGATVDGEPVVSNITIPVRITLQQCQLTNGFDFSASSFTHKFQLIDCAVGSAGTTQEPEATFKGSHFASDVVFKGTTTFQNGLDFSNVEVEGTFESDGASYNAQSPDDEADFNDVQVRHTATFQGATFQGGGLDLTGAELAELLIEGDPADGNGSLTSPAMNLLIDRAQIGKGLKIENLVLSGLGARSATVQSGAVLNLTLRGPVFLSGGHFDSIIIKGLSQWRAQANESQFDGLSFNSVSTDSGRKPNALGMLDLLNLSTPYNSQPYIALEKLVRGSGDSDDADEVYFDMRMRERAQLDPFGEFLDWLEYELVGYGRQVWRAAILALVLVVLGTCLFWNRSGKKMEHEDDSADNWFNPFWYSLDLLSPVDLGISSKWRPRNSLLRNYAQFQRVAGWILIPLIAAAITGIIK